TADISVYADGTAAAGVMFNNDLTDVRKGAWGAPLPPHHYTVKVALNGESKVYTVAQHQYQSWITRLPGDHRLVNIQRDLGYLEQAGAILSYDRTTGVANDAVRRLTGCASQVPFAANCLEKHMPTGGGRNDIGYTTRA